MLNSYAGFAVLNTAITLYKTRRFAGYRTALRQALHLPFLCVFHLISSQAAPPHLTVGQVLAAHQTSFAA